MNRASYKLPLFEDTLAGKQPVCDPKQAPDAVALDEADAGGARNLWQDRVRREPVNARAVLRLTDVVKAFPGVIALKDVSLEVVEGEVHALLGENGAGKSTLMAVAAGAIAHDRGTVEIGGAPLTVASPSLAQSLGISVVYQHTSVLDDLTVAENLLYCVRPERRAGAAKRPRLGRRATRGGRRAVRQAAEGQASSRSPNASSSRSPRRSLHNRKCWFSTSQRNR